MNKNPLWSIIIPVRNEFPNVVSTFHSIINSLESDGWDHKDFEIILVDNCSDDDIVQQRGTVGTTSYLEPRGAYANRILRIVRDPIAGNHSARNTGAKIARGEYLFFSDGHMQYRNHFFKYIKETIDETGGIAHGSVLWQGAYPVVDRNLGFQYTTKIGSDIKQTWANYKLADEPWYISGQGAWGVGVKRKQFLDFRGWQPVHRTYGGEFYLSFKWWMLGSSVAVHPKAVGWHLSSKRHYEYSHHHYKENILGNSYALGADSWRERAYLNWMMTTSKDILDPIMARNEIEYAEDRRWIEKHRKMTFDEMLVNKPWDQRNMKKFGKTNSSMLIYHYTWLEEMMKHPVVLEAYKKSKYQKELAQLIQTKLKDHIYRPENYSDLTKFEGLI